MTDYINHPPHYKQGDVETIDIIEQVIKSYEPIIAFNIGQVIKYVARAPFKGNMLQDLQKAQWYLNRAIELLRKRQEGEVADKEETVYYDNWKVKE